MHYTSKNKIQQNLPKKSKYCKIIHEKTKIKKRIFLKITILRFI